MKKILALVVFLLALGGGWWLYSNKGSLTSKATGPLQNVSLRLKWVHQAQFAGNYVAVEKGFYKAQGLNVDLQPINLEENTVDAVVEGKLDFGISSGDDLILARSKGKPVKVVAVIYKVNPAAVISLEENKILSPSDLVGKKIGIQKGNPIEYLFDVMLENKGIKQGQIKKVAIGYDASEILQGKVDAILGYITNEPDMIAQAGKKPSSILLADYGVDMYADVLFTSDKMIEEKPELVEKMVKATFAGWKFAIENEKKAVEDTLKYSATKSAGHEEYMLKSSTPLIHKGNSRLGEMDPVQWERMKSTLENKKMISKGFDVTSVYTNSFIQKVYE